MPKSVLFFLPNSVDVNILKCRLYSTDLYFVYCSVSLFVQGGSGAGSPEKTTAVENKPKKVFNYGSQQVMEGETKYYSLPPPNQGFVSSHPLTRDLYPPTP